LFPSAFTWAMTVSGMGITSQLRREIFIQYSEPWTCILLGVLGLWLLHGVSSSCTWQYCPTCRLKCFL
jgi:hypothetical protein